MVDGKTSITGESSVRRQEAREVFDAAMTALRSRSGDRDERAACLFLVRHLVSTHGAWPARFDKPGCAEISYGGMT